MLAALLGERVVAYHPLLAHAVGNVAAALFLSQLLYWYNIMDRKYGDGWDGWFYKSWAEINQETGLTRKEQETARKVLKKAGIIQEKLQGVPATLHYNISIDALCNAIQAHLDAQKGTTRCAKEDNLMRKKVQLDAQKGTTIHDTTHENTHQTTHEKAAAAPVVHRTTGGDADPAAAAAPPLRKKEKNRDFSDDELTCFLIEQVGVAERVVPKVRETIIERGYSLLDLEILLEEIDLRPGVRNKVGLFLTRVQSNDLPQNRDRKSSSDVNDDWARFRGEID